MPASDVTVNATFKAKSTTDVQGKNDNTTAQNKDKNNGNLSENAPAVYSITLEKTVNGKFSTDLASATKNTTVKVTTTPNEGYQVNTITITDVNGSPVSYTGEDNAYAFIMPAGDVFVSVSFAQVSVDATDSAETQTENIEKVYTVDDVVDNNVLEDTSNGNLLLWILPAVLVALIAALIILLIIRKKKLESNYK